MHNYHDTYAQLPFGATGRTTTVRQTWVVYLWPYIEQEGVYLLYISATENASTQPFYTPPASNPNLMTGATGANVPQYKCPSDNGFDIDDLAGNTYCRRRGNYVVNWGNTSYEVATPAGTGLAPFAHIGGNPATPETTRLTDITDGTSSTLMMSECLMAHSHDDNDWRGDIQNDGGQYFFCTINTPNSSTPDQINSASYDDGVNDLLMPITTGLQLFAARSRHTGGVNVSMCDASIHFIANTISVKTWRRWAR